MIILVLLMMLADKRINEKFELPTKCKFENIKIRDLIKLRRLGTLMD